MLLPPWFDAGIALALGSGCIAAVEALAGLRNFPLQLRQSLESLPLTQQSQMVIALGSFWEAPLSAQAGAGYHAYLPTHQMHPLQQAGQSLCPSHCDFGQQRTEPVQADRQLHTSVWHVATPLIAASQHP